MHVLDSWDFGGKGFDLETPKKYTFALVEVKWVLFCMDFSKIAVLFLCILIFVFFLCILIFVFFLCILRQK